MTSFMDRVFYADLCGGGNRFLLKPAATVISARRAGTDHVYKLYSLKRSNENGYYILGERVGNAFKDGKKLDI